jgi:UDP-N-acetylglucosamine 2-epimerase (non-hydrolysing)
MAIKLKVATVVGTRPEIIRLSALIPLLDEHTEHLLIHTGQNNDPNLSDVFFRDLKLRKPDVHLGISNATPGTAMAQTLIGVEKVFAEFCPDAVIVLGDTNSAIALLIARRMTFTTYHLEAGNRSFDANVPEEINRKLVDHVSTFNLPYSEHARRNLLDEGIDPRFICLSGSPMKQVLSRFSSEIETSGILSALNLQPQRYFVVSAHRQENVDNKERLQALIDAVEALTQEYDVDAVLPLHPRTRKKLGEWGLSFSSRVVVTDPLGFFDFVSLQQNSLVALSDSGTISEESAILDFKAVTLRDSMERPEALESGSIVMAGLDVDSVSRSVRIALSGASVRSVPIEYLVDNFAERVLAFIESTAPRAHEWLGIRK